MTEVLTSPFDDFIVLSSGDKIYPEEVEDFYTKVAPVKQMCVFTVSGMHGVKRSKILWAIIQPNLDNFREFGEVNLRAVLKERFDNASQSLLFYKRLKGFTITLDDLPLKLSGKLNRSKIKKIYEPRVIAGKEGALPVTGELSADDLLLTGSVIGKRILQCLKELSGIRRP